jgi:hypothetical protein
MDRKRARIFLLVSFFLNFIFLSSCSVIQPGNPHKSPNKGNPMEPTRQISRVYPTKRDANRYLDSDKKKKKRWTKVRQISAFDCPWDRSFTSSAEKKVKCKLHRTRAKLKREIKRNN